jgi:hypothetical protein
MGKTGLAASKFLAGTQYMNELNELLNWLSGLSMLVGPLHLALCSLG